MKSLWITVVLCAAMMAKAENSCGLRYELIVSMLKTLQDTNKAMEQELRTLSAQVSNLAIKVDQITSDQSQFRKIKPKIDVVTSQNSRCPEHVRKRVQQLTPLSSSPFPVDCEEDWIVIQRRINGSLSFNRRWHEYRDGFGEIEGEHWLGLEKVHQITREGSYELMVVLKSFDGEQKSAKYEGFNISSELKQYRLEFERFVGGDAGNGLSIYNGMKFSTPDRDNDTDERDCGMRFESGWWFANCYYSNLNGVYAKGETGIEWWDFNNRWEGLRESQMMIRLVV